MGRLQYEQEKYGEAKKYYEMNCKKANSKDIYKMEWIDGEISEVPAISGIQWSCLDLGIMYRVGKGVRQDFSKAMQYYKKSCDLEYGDSCTQMGFLYYLGESVKKELNRAKELFTKSCKLDDGSGCLLLGAMYHNGEGVKKDLSKAKEYYGKACDFGEQMGCDGYKELNEMNIK